MKGKTMRHWVCRNAFAVGLTVGASVMLTSCEDDTLTGQPDWLGNSIYEWLQNEGKYKTTLRLIDELGEAETLSRTGSRTLFVADDQAYEEWFASDNIFGVKSYEELSPAQKKLLLNSSMIRNSYLVELLSNVEGVESMRGGRCMRRPSAVTIYDSIPRIYPEDMPGYNGAIAPDDSPGPASWKRHYGKADGMLLLKDNTPPPMIHYLPAFMNYKNFTGEDLSYLTQGAGNSTGEAWVNGRKIVDQDITCKNGYIHKVDGVIEPLTNMADIVHQHPEMSRWAMLMDRFSTPYYAPSASYEYNRLYNDGVNKDSVFVLRYISDWAASWSLTAEDENGNFISGYFNSVPYTGDFVLAKNRLSFDPGWNRYMYDNTSGNTFYYDAGVMLVPTNEALEAWFNDGVGKDLQNKFQTWEGIPDLTLKDLLNAGMVESFSDHLPTMFGTILDKTTQLELGVKKEHIDAVYTGCNGVVYLVNQVYTPKSYSSVSFPAQLNAETANLGVIYWALDNCEYLPYVNSMESTYCLLLPAINEEGALWYVDPVKYGSTAQSLLKFTYDETKMKVVASRYNCTVNEDGTVTPGSRTEQNVDDIIIKNRLTDILEHLIVVMDDGAEVDNESYEYYKTKGGSYLRVNRDNGLAFQGAWQIENNCSIAVDVDEETGGMARFPKENGVSYRLAVEGAAQMPLSSTRSVYMLLKEHNGENTVGDDAYAEFYNLMMAADGAESMFAASMGGTNNNTYTCANSSSNMNVRLFENYNYTLYIPTNESIKALTKVDSNGYSGEGAVLPTWEDYKKISAELESLNLDAEDYQTKKDSLELIMGIIEERINNFIRYHIQDNSRIIGENPESGSYETMLVNPANGRFYSLDITQTADDLKVGDQISSQPRSVVKENGLYNNICREYWFKVDGSVTASGDNAKVIYMSSDVVVHQIDGVLLPQELTPWRDEVAATVNQK